AVRDLQDKVLVPLLSQLEEQWHASPPTLRSLDPALDLPMDMQRDAQRLLLEAASDDVDARVRARLRLLQLYRRAGRANVAMGLLRAALNEPSEDAWLALDGKPDSLDDLVELRAWQLPVGAPAGVALVDDDTGVLVGSGDRLFRIDRHRNRVRPLVEVGERQWLLRSIAPNRALVLG